MRASFTSGWAALALASAGAGAGLAAGTKPLWATGGQGSPPRTPLMSDVVPTRAQQLMRLHESSLEKPFDVLIIGGGATGTGCALDAATRGLRTALVERGDWACGTSSKSTKLVHGGVRYLEKAVLQFDYGQLKLVYEALHERSRLLANAPHLAKPLAIVTPCYKWWEVPYYWAGMKAYDLVAGSSTLVLSKYVGPTETLSWLPALATNLRGHGLKGSILYYDGHFDDARLNVTLACSAAAAGAAVSNYMECVKLLKNEQGQVIGAQCRDVLSGEVFDIHARLVINATGPFTDQIRRMSDPGAHKTLEHSNGAHVVLPAYYSSSHTGVIIPKTSDGRVVFLLPFQGYTLAGTTDVACGAERYPRSSHEEMQYLLSTISDYLGVRVTPSDVLSTWSGVRPLPSNPHAQKKDTQSIVRDHVIFMDDDGLLNVTGGKWTTYRRMAEETVNAAIESGRLPLNTRACATEKLALLGGHDYHRTLFAEVAQQYCRSPSNNNKSLSGDSVATRPPVISTDTAQHLCDAYGDRVHAVLAVAAEQGLGGLLVPEHPYIEAEVVYCTQNEYCMTVEDFLARRTRLAFLDVRAAKAAAPKVAALMARSLGWTDEYRQRQIADAIARLEAGFTEGPVVQQGEPGPPVTTAAAAVAAPVSAA